MNVGFIGVGSMGSLLIDAFISSGALDPNQITASNRTFEKAEKLTFKYPGLQAAASNQHAAIDRDVIFLCVKPHEYETVIVELQPIMKAHQVLIAITSPVMLDQLEKCLSCKIAKIIPSITNYMHSGATLCMYGKRMSAEDKASLNQLLAFISTPLTIDEQHTRIVSDLSSCGPAFMAYLLQCFIDAAVEETGISREEAVAVASAMFLGTGQLLTEGGMTPEALQERVAVPGGITAKALELLDSKLSGVFNAVIKTTHAKYKEDLDRVTVSLQDKEVNGS